MGSMIVPNGLKNSRLYSLFRPFSPFAKTGGFSMQKPNVNFLANSAFDFTRNMSSLLPTTLKNHDWNVYRNKRPFSNMPTSFAKIEESNDSKKESLDKQGFEFSRKAIDKIYKEAKMFKIPDLFLEREKDEIKTAKILKELIDPYKILGLKNLWIEIQDQNPKVKKFKVENLSEDYEQIHEAFIKWVAENKEHITCLSIFPFSVDFLPEEIGYLSNLEYLDITCNSLEVFPAFICELTNLKVLDLSTNKIKVIPDSICELKKLNTLNLSYNQIEYLPDSFFNFPNLVSLHLEYNKLKELPKSKGNMPEIRNLHLEFNKLVDFPEIFGTAFMYWLRNGRSNKIYENKIPYGLSDFLKLTNLYLDNNKLHDLPKTLGNLPNLKILTLHNNKLTELPGEIGFLGNLSKLTLHNNKLHDLPNTIGNLSKLYFELTLHNNRLTTFPNSIAKLENLKVISAKGNPFNLFYLGIFKVICPFRISTGDNHKLV